MGVMQPWFLPIDTTQGLWLNAERDEFGICHFSVTIVGEEISISEIQYEELNKQFAEALKDGQRSGRMYVLNLLKKNLDRFDYSNNSCDQLSFDEFAKLCDEQ